MSKEIPNLMISRPEREGGPTLLVSFLTPLNHVLYLNLCGQLKNVIFHAFLYFPCSQLLTHFHAAPHIQIYPIVQYVTHRKGQVDFKVSPVKQLEDGTWEYCETMEVRFITLHLNFSTPFCPHALTLTPRHHPLPTPRPPIHQDPETTGYFKHTVDAATGDQEIAFFATAPKKWCLKFSVTPAAEGVWTCTNEGGGAYTKTATVADVAPAASKFGAGGLPKGQVNLGVEGEDWGSDPWA